MKFLRKILNNDKNNVYPAILTKTIRSCRNDKKKNFNNSYDFFFPTIMLCIYLSGSISLSSVPIFSISFTEFIKVALNKNDRCPFIAAAGGKVA